MDIRKNCSEKICNFIIFEILVENHKNPYFSDKRVYNEIFLRNLRIIEDLWKIIEDL